MTEPATRKTRRPSRRPSYTHAVFSDFSGDDGIQFDKGSSSCLTLAWVVTREQDVQHNEDVLFEIKKKVRCRLTDELKYRSLRRHPANKEAALKLLQKLKVDVYCVVVFKKAFLEEQGGDSLYADPKNKGLVVVMQAFPFSHLLDELREKYGDVRPRIIVDQLHWKQTQERIVDLVSDEKSWFRKESFQFRSSGGTPLLQVADLFCGAVRESCEQLEGHELPPCHVCRSRNYKPMDCAWRRSRKRPPGFRSMKAVYPLLFFSPRYEHRVTRGLYLLPGSMNDRLEFIDCLLGRK